MALFSERYGYKSVRDSLQFECINHELRNAIWNVFFEYFLSHIRDAYFKNMSEFTQIFVTEIWCDFFNLPLDRLTETYFRPFPTIKEHFFNCEWYEIYDLLEFIALHYPFEDLDKLIEEFDSVLENFNAGYHFVFKHKISPIHSEIEIKAIEEALENTPDPIQIHLNEALKLLSNKKNPDYRNSIKESISAVESICKLITKNPNSTLGKCLNRIENKVGLHPALKEAFRKLYGYTNDSNGIRHALLKESNLDSEDAVFMLVSCSTFINYLLAKAGKADISVDKKQEQYPEIFESLKMTLKNNNVDFEKTIEEFGQVEAAEKRDAGSRFTFSEHLQALIYSMLSNRRRWIDIVNKLPQIDEIFFNFDLEKLENCDSELLINQLKKAKCGNISIYKQIEALPHNIRQFKKIEKDYGSLDEFVTHDSPAKVVKLLSKGDSNYKIKQMGDALALEYLKSVGIRGMKPDVHIERICGPGRLDIIPAKNTSKQLDEFKRFAEKVNVNETYLDNLFWIFGAKGYGEICTENPQCHKCGLKPYCNYK